MLFRFVSLVCCGCISCCCILPRYLSFRLHFLYTRKVYLLPSASPSQIAELLVRITSKNRPGYYWAIDEGTEGYLMQEAEMFRIKSPGLNGVSGSISFESVLRPGYYIVNKNGMIDVDSLSNSGFNEMVYNNECSWYARKNLYFNGFTSFESTTRPGLFIRHSNRKLQTSTIGTQADRNDASFLMNDAFTGGQADLYVESWTTLLGKTITVESKAVPSYFWQTDAKEAFLQSQGEVFRMVEGVSGEANTVSFESTSRPGYYLCVAGNKIIIVRLVSWSESASGLVPLLLRNCISYLN